MAKLFPNPANELLNIEVETDKVLKFKIIDTQGKVWPENDTWPTCLKIYFQLSVRHQTSGVYWLQYQTHDGQIKTNSLQIRKQPRCLPLLWDFGVH